MLEFFLKTVASSFINSWTINIRKYLRNIFQLPDFTNEKFEVQRHMEFAQVEFLFGFSPLENDIFIPKNLQNWW